VYGGPRAVEHERAPERDALELLPSSARAGPRRAGVPVRAPAFCLSTSGLERNASRATGSRAAARLRGGPDAPGCARRDASGGGPPTSALVRRRTASPSSGEIIDDCAPLAYISTCLRGAGRGTCFEFVQHPSDERVCAGPPHRLERPVEGGGDLLNASARGEIPQH